MLIDTAYKNFRFLILVLIILGNGLPCFAQKEPKGKDAAPPANTPPDPDSYLKKELKPGEIFNCEADIYYEWETINPIEKPKDPKAPETSPTPPPIKQKQFVETLVERGKDGILSKSRLESRLAESKSNALTLCKNAHNIAECKSQKISLAKKELQILDFQTKRTLLNNILETCDEHAGKCLETSNSEIRCQIYRSPEAPMPKEEPVATAAPAKK